MKHNQHMEYSSENEKYLRKIKKQTLHINKSELYLS